MMQSNPVNGRCVTRVTSIRCAMRNFLLVCLFSLSGLALAQEPVGQPEPVIEEQGATQQDSVSEDSSVASEPAIEQPAIEQPAIEQKATQQADPAVDPPSRVARL